MRITLRQLGVFVAVARHGTVTRAAEELNLTQSAASMALADLETQLTSQLFDRTGKRLQLNDLGRRLLPTAITTLAHAQSIEDTARGEDNQIGSLKIGASLTIGNYLMPPVIAAFLREHPQSRLTLDIANTRQIITALEQFDLDIGFIEGHCHAPDLEVIPWREDRLVVFCSPGHPLAMRETLCEDDFAAAEWVLREAGSGTREIFDNAVTGRLAHPRILLELGHTEAIQRVVASGLGVGCASWLTVGEGVRNGSLKILDTPFWNLDRRLYILIHRQKYRTHGLHRFLDHCVRESGVP